MIRLALLLTLLPAAAWAQWAPTLNDFVGERYAAGIAALPNGQVLLTGGHGGAADGWLESTALWDPTTNLWSVGNPMPAAHRTDRTLVELDSGEFLYAGGNEHLGGHPHPTSSVRYDPGLDAWTTTAGTPVEFRASAFMNRLPDGRVLFTGGYENHSNTSAYSSAEVYDPTTDA